MACIVAIPVCAARAHFAHVLWLVAIISAEGLLILVNKGRCPLTDIAARYTSDRRDNFDIYLPLWLARYNKQLFGGLFGLGASYALLLWANSPTS